jgi:hypothetical protein
MEEYFAWLENWNKEMEERYGGIKTTFGDC